MPQLGQGRLGNHQLGNLEATATSTVANAVTSTDVLNVVTLSPDNLHVVYDESAGEFRTEWFTKKSPLDDDVGEIIIVGQFRKEEFDPIDIVVERDTDDDDTPEMATKTVTLDDSNHILRIAETDVSEDLPEDGGRYRLRFPGYNQTDAITRLTFALGFNSERKFNEEWSISPVSPKEEPLRAMLAVLLSENYRFDATLDEIFEAQHISTSNDKSLEYLAHEVGTSRKAGENDPHLRKRVLGASATRTFSSAGDDVTDLVGLVFDEEAEQVTLGVKTDEPVLEVSVPQSVMDAHILSAAEIEDLFDEAVSSSYTASVVTV